MIVAGGRRCFRARMFFVPGCRVYFGEDTNKSSFYYVLVIKTARAEILKVSRKIGRIIKAMVKVKGVPTKHWMKVKGSIIVNILTKLTDVSLLPLKNAQRIDALLPCSPNYV